MTDETMPSAATTPDDAAPVVTIHPPDATLKQKLGHGGFNPRNIEAAQKRLLAARADFPTIARRELHVINASLLALYDPLHLLKEIFSAAVDLKANGGLFAYKIVTRIADSLIQFTEKLTTIDAASLTIIQLHYDALQLVFERGHDVMTVEQCDEMLDGLSKAVTKYQHKTAGITPAED